MVFSKKKGDFNFDKIDSLIGVGSHFQGVISSQGTIRVDGTFTGEIKTEGDLVIGDSGTIDANIEARNVLVAGEIKGNLQVNGKIEVTVTGKVFGDIKVKNLIVDEGAIFEGSCLMDNGKVEKNDKKLNIEEATNIVV